VRLRARLREGKEGEVACTCGFVVLEAERVLKIFFVLALKDRRGAGWRELVDEKSRRGEVRRYVLQFKSDSGFAIFRYHMRLDARMEYAQQKSRAKQKD